MAWVVGKWAWVDGSGSKVLFAQIELIPKTQDHSKLSYIAVIPAVIAVKNTRKIPTNKTNRNKVFAWLG